MDIVILFENFKNFKEKHKKKIYSTLLIGSIVIAIIYLIGCTQRKYNFSTDMVTIKGTIKSEPYIQHLQKNGSEIRFRINELPCELVSYGNRYSRYIDEEILSDFKKNDSVQIHLLKTDYEDYIDEINSFHFFEQRLVFYSAIRNNRDYAHISPSQIEMPNYLIEGLFAFAILMGMIIGSYIKLLEVID